MVFATHEMTISARQTARAVAVELSARQTARAAAVELSVRQTARAAAVDLLPTTIETRVWNFIARYIMFID